MAFFRTHREAGKATNRIIGSFIVAMAILTLAFAAVLVGHYVLSWW